MENEIKYTKDGITFIHDGDFLNIIFDKNLYNDLESNRVSASNYAWEVYTYCKEDLLIYGNAVNIPLGFKINVFNLLSDPYEGETDDEYVLRTEDETRYYNRLFNLPKSIAGQIEIKADGINAYDANYRIKLLFFEKNSTIPRPYDSSGLVVKVGANLYGLDYLQAKAFSEYRKYQAKINYTENDHYSLVGHIKKIVGEDLKKEENRFKNLQVSEVKKVRLNISELENGDLELSPNLIGMEAKDERTITRELNQVREDDTSKTLHIGNELIQLNEASIDGINEIKSSKIIKNDEKDAFFNNIGSFIDASKVDLDGFSYRVQGITEYVHANFSDVKDGNNDWFLSNSPILIDEFEPFINNHTELDDFEDKSLKAVSNKAENVAFKNRVFSVPAKSELNDRISKLRVDLSNKTSDEKPDKAAKKAVTFSIKYLEGRNSLHDSYNEFSLPANTLNNLKVQPYTYQKEAVEWIYSLYRSSINSESDIKGGVLADDMGLGKTFSSLLGLKSIIEYEREINQTEYSHKNKCFLVVAPLSLLKNWKEEINNFFSVNPFQDIVILNAQNDLKKFRYQKGNERIQAVEAKTPIIPENLKRCLKVGDEFGFDRLDIPGRLILTTYETMRDYQFSLAAMQFYCVIFDEAQKIKNPNSLATHAAKALNSDINIMATGTPVENNLLEYWCIMDTANPKLFGTQKQFEETFIQPLKDNTSNETKLKIGQELYSTSGPFLLRRSKEELKNILGDQLPNKYEFKGLSHPDYNYLDFLDKPLTGSQQVQYERVREEKEKDPNPGAALKGLHRLKACMIHPELTFTNKLDHLANVTRDEFWNESAKLQSLLRTLYEVKAKKEKIIIFSISRSIQYLIKKWVKIEFDLDVDIISGETKVESYKEEETRLGKIKLFGSKPGFNVIILSPLAAGVGLNVKAANHIFHLERHWNPAKEAQANDRAYRIGQKKDVSIYYPIGKHPEFESFDIKLDSMLSRKTFIKDALITFPRTSENELAKEIW